MECGHTKGLCIVCHLAIDLLRLAFGFPARVKEDQAQDDEDEQQVFCSSDEEEFHAQFQFPTVH